MLTDEEFVAVWREARREALEEAARVCERMGPRDHSITGYFSIPALYDGNCAAAIRALIDKEPRT